MQHEPGPAAIGPFVSLDGETLRAEDARISPFDRGYLFAHAAYEVTAVYGGRLVDWPGHAARLGRTLEGLDIPAPMDSGALEALHLDLARRNGMDEGLIYLQVTAGAYGGRDFAGPETFAPSLFLFTTAKPLITTAARDGIAAISAPDTRWARRDYKTTQLVTQALAYRAAHKAGADTAILHEDGVITEAASANLWCVGEDGVLRTRNLSASILAGITRETVLTLLGGEIEVEERAVTLEEARAARELFTTSAGALIAPIVRLDGAPVGAGAPGPVVRRVQARYYRAMGADLATAAPWAMA